ncbi:MAG: class I SAM-dependent methyltransferase, partial [Pseudomonadota bacterium]
MFNRANDVPYKRFMKRLHESLLFDWYMEVGCRTGSILAMARGKSIGVDPYFLMETNIVGVKPRFLTFQETSDDFFASRFLETNKIKLSFSFLDGMHLYEYLLRDFINTEKNSKPGGVIAMHDCCPYDSAMTTRDLENLPRGDWTG